MLRLNVTAKQGSETNRTTNSIVYFIEFHVHVRKYFCNKLTAKNQKIIAWYGTPVNITVNKSTL